MDKKMAAKGTDLRIGDVARDCGLLGRIAFKVKEGETVLHLDYSIDRHDLVVRVIMLFMLLWVPAIEFLFFVGLPPFGELSKIWLTVSLAFLGAAIPVTTMLVVKRRQLNKYAVVNVSVFTDKAIYTTHRAYPARIPTSIGGLPAQAGSSAVVPVLDRKRIPEEAVTRIPWEDVKVYTMERSILFKIARKLQINVFTSYDLVTGKHALPACSDPATTKCLFESLLHKYHPLSVQRADYLAKKGSPADSASFPASAPLLRRIKKRRILLAIIDPPVDVAVIALGQWIIDSIPWGPGMDFMYWYIVVSFCLIMVVVVFGQTADILHMFWFRVPPESAVRAREGGIEQQGINGDIAAAFSRETIVWVAKLLSRPDHLGASTLSRPRAVTRFGPVDDAYGCYYAAMEQLHAWLAGDGYFMDLEGIQNVAIASHPYMAAIVRKLTGAGGVGEEQAASDDAIAAIGRVHATIGRTDDIYRLLVPMTLDAARPSLRAAIERYIDVIAPGERVLFVHHPAGKQARPQEAIATTEGLIVAGSPRFLKVKYQEMVALRAGEVARDRMSFKEVTIELRPGSSAPRIVLGRVPVDSPLFAILYKEAGTALAYQKGVKTTTTSGTPSIFS